VVLHGVATCRYYAYGQAEPTKRSPRRSVVSPPMAKTDGLSYSDVDAIHAAAAGACVRACVRVLRVL